MNLIDDPWIDCLDTAGRLRTVGMLELVDSAAELALAEPDPLLEGAIWRILAAVGYAAGAYPDDEDAYDKQIVDGSPDLAAMGRYLVAHRGDFDLFDPDRPFWQDASLRHVVGTGSERPAVYLDITAAVDRPLLADQRHLVSAHPLTPVQAARALLVQITWGLGGRTQGTDKDLGYAHATNSLPAPLNSRILVCPDAPTVALGLAWRLMPTPNAGTPTWTYPADADGAASKLPLDGEATGLTWLSRRVLLVPGPGGSVSGVVIARGRSYLDPASDEPATGWSDVLTDAVNCRPAHCVDGGDDLVPIVASFAEARPGSLIFHIAAAAGRVGVGTDLIVIGLVGQRSQKRVHLAWRVPVPAAVFTTPDACETAQAIVDLRRACGPRAPRAAGVAEYLHWLTRTDRDIGDLLVHVRDLLVQHAPDALSGAPDAVRTLRAIHRTASQAATALGVVLAEDGDTTVDGDTEPVDLDDLSAFLAEFDDPGLFATGNARPAPTVADDPAGVLVRRLSGYVRSGNYRGTLSALRRYALRPSPAHKAMRMATRDLPTDHLVAATTTAALFAVLHHTGNVVHAGRTPLPRLARSFGGAQRGPQDSAVNSLIIRAVHTPAVHLLPVLVPLIRRAMRTDAYLDWTGLYHDLARWDNADKLSRTRWIWLFSSPQPVAEIDAMLTKGSPRCL